LQPLTTVCIENLTTMLRWKNMNDINPEHHGNLHILD
jgi:hypothetical protein